MSKEKMGYFEKRFHSVYGVRRLIGIEVSRVCRTKLPKRLEGSIVI